MRILSLLLLLSLTAPAFARMDDDCKIQSLTSEDSAFLADSLEGNLFKIELKNGMQFALSEFSASNANFNDLTPEVRQKFYKRRKQILSAIAIAMAFPRGIGAISWLKERSVEKIRSCLKRSGKNDKEQSIAEKIVGDTVTALNRDSGTVRARGQEVIAQTLKMFDALLWEDASVLTEAKSFSVSGFVGVSSGASVRKFGYYYFRGVEVDVGLDFETGNKFVKFSKGKMKLKDSYFCFEHLLVVGATCQFQMDSNHKTETVTSISLPSVLGYRRSGNTVAPSLVSGVSLLDFATIGLVYYGHYTTAGIYAAATYGLSMASVYWTDYTKTSLYRKDFRQKSCESKLNAPEVER